MSVLNQINGRLERLEAAIGKLPAQVTGPLWRNVLCGVLSYFVTHLADLYVWPGIEAWLMEPAHVVHQTSPSIDDGEPIPDNFYNR